MLKRLLKSWERVKFNQILDTLSSKDYFVLFIILKRSFIFLIILSPKGIRWILWFSIRYAAAATTRREIFGVNALRGKLHQLGPRNLQDIVIGG